MFVNIAPAKFVAKNKQVNTAIITSEILTDSVV